MTEVHIVVARQGDWSERVEWIAGVYLDKAQAIAMAEEKLRAAREATVRYDAWLECHHGVLRDLGRAWHTPETDAISRARCGPAPHVEADDFTVVSVPIGVWGKYDGWGR